ncbi:MAG: BglII/BstYI family type II restriction endonuclease [bacterium]|nr:BglII/BstYI family type II restriction endonuclease [bacterium]
MEHDDDAVADAEDVVDLAGQVRDITVSGLPEGYDYKATRYADVVLKEAFPNRFRDLTNALEQFEPTLDELRSGGGNKTPFVDRFDSSLAEQLENDRIIWGKQNITIQKHLGFDGKLDPASSVRGHEIDMFGLGSFQQPLPGIAVEMEWNNKDPFFDRDLINFQALHHEGAIALGVIVTRGPDLQELLSTVFKQSGSQSKYSASTTHWKKLIPRVNLGGGGECPLLLIGIRPERIQGIELAYRVRKKLDEAEELRTTWRETYESWDEAKPVIDEIRNQAYKIMPPVSEK